MKIQQYSTIILLSLVALVLMPLAAPVVADSPQRGTAPAIGMKVRVSENTELTLLAVSDGEYTWRARITPELARPDGKSIDPMWHYSGKGWTAGANLFAASVTGHTVRVEYGGEVMTWTPRLVLRDSFLGLPNNKQMSANLPRLLAIDPWNENYAGNTLEWQYGSGIVRRVRLIEGLIQEYYEIAAPIGQDVVFDVSPDKSAGYTWARSLVAWDANGDPVELVYDNEYTVRLLANTDAAYPITIDPDSSFTTSSSDGYTYKDSELVYVGARDSYPADYAYPTSTASRVGQDRNTDVYRIYRAFVYFDTSGLTSAANVVNASLSIRASSDYSDTNFNVTIVSGMPARPADPFTTTDYRLSYYNTTSLGSVSTSTWTGYKTITLNANGIASINVTGTTKYALLSSKDIASIAPTGDEYVLFYTYEQGTGYWPYLEVTYTALSAPIGTTLAATNVANSTARVNAYINSSGGELCDVRFQYGNTTETYTNATDWVNNTYDTGSYPYADLTSLEPETTYYYRVQVSNSQGIYNGTELNFTTANAISEPTNFRATVSGTTISLSWLIGSGASNTLVRGKAGSYPSSITDGTQVYFGAGGTATHSGLDEGTTYYYTAWGESGGGYSSTTAQTLGTTGIGTSETGLPATPSAPTSWWRDTDPTRLSGLPLYNEFNDVILGYGVQATTGWQFVFLSIVLLVTAAAFGATNGNVMVAGMTSAVLLFVFSMLRLMPLWVMGMALIIFVSIAIVRERA